MKSIQFEPSEEERKRTEFAAAMQEYRMAELRAIQYFKTRPDQRQFPMGWATEMYVWHTWNSKGCVGWSYTYGIVKEKKRYAHYHFVWSDVLGCPAIVVVCRNCKIHEVARFFGEQ